MLPNPPLADAPALPAGYTPLSGPMGPYFAALGTVYHRRAADGTLQLALRVAQAHCNIQGIPHGGMLMTLADGAIGINLVQARQPPQPQVTVSMTTDFLGAAQVGDWLEAAVTVRKMGRRLAFGECLLVVGERPILRASAAFTVIDRPGPAVTDL